MTQSHAGFYLRVLGLTLFLVVLGCVGLTAFSTQLFDEVLRPAIAGKAETLGDSINFSMKKALDAGVPFDKVPGVDEYLASLLERNPTVAYLSYTDNDGRLLHHRGQTPPSFPPLHGSNAMILTDLGDYQDAALPLIWRNRQAAWLHVGLDKAYIQRKQRESLADLGTVVLVTLLITFELVKFLINHRITGPLLALGSAVDLARRGQYGARLPAAAGEETDRFAQSFNQWCDELRNLYDSAKARVAAARAGGRPSLPAEELMSQVEAKCNFSPTPLEIGFEQRLAYIRPALFLLIFAEALSLSFMPMYIGELCDSPFYSTFLYRPLENLPRQVLIGLPISVFMLFWALSQPFAGAWSDRAGRRRAFMVGGLLTAAGLIGSGLAGHVFDLLCIRALSGVGYGIVFITCTAYVTDHTTPANRAQGMGIFLAGFFSGSLSGAAIGGILADRLGYRPVFLLSGALAIGAVLFVRSFLPEKPGAAGATKKKIGWQEFRLLLSNPRFVALTVLMAIPAKMCLTGFMNYTAPLYLKELGNSQSVIGRVLMAYGLVMVFVAPLMGRLADRWGNRALLVKLSALVAGGGLTITYLWANTYGVLASILLMGLAHAVGVSSQLALLPELCRTESGAIGSGTVMGVFRLIERSGSILGPLLAGILIAKGGYPQTFIVIGLLTIGGMLLFAVVCRKTEPAPAPVAQPAGGGGK